MASKGTVLLVDDDGVFRHSMMERIVAEGYEALEAATGEEGLTQLRGGGIDVAICDMLMPGMGGLRLLGEIKADERIKNTSIIVISALGEQSDIEKARAAGASAYLVKGTFAPSDVLAKIAEMISNKAADSHSA